MTRNYNISKNCNLCGHKTYCAGKDEVNHCFYQSRPDKMLDKEYESYTYSVRKQRNRKEGLDYE